MSAAKKSSGDIKKPMTASSITRASTRLSTMADTPEPSRPPLDAAIVHKPTQPWYRVVPPSTDGLPLLPEFKDGRAANPRSCDRCSQRHTPYVCTCDGPRIGLR